LGRGNTPTAKRADKGSADQAPVHKFDFREANLGASDKASVDKDSPLHHNFTMEGKVTEVVVEDSEEEEGEEAISPGNSVTSQPKVRSSCTSPASSCLSFGSFTLHLLTMPLYRASAS
jgi:hypothetical protein